MSSDATPGHVEPSARHRRIAGARLGWAAGIVVTVALIALSTGLVRWRTQAASPSLPPEFFKVWELIEAQQAEEAEKSLDHLMRQRQHGGGYLVLDGALSLLRGDFEAAESRIVAAQATGALRPYAREVLGRSFYWRNQLYEAEQIFLTLAREAPRSFAAHLWLGVVYHDLHMFGQAMHELRLASEIQPTDTRPHILQGSIHNRYGRYRTAAEQYRQALQSMPPGSGASPTSDNPLIIHLVKCLVRDGQFKEGLERIAAVSDPSVELQILRAECLLGLGQLAEAERECRAAFERDENQLAAVITLVKVGLQQMVTAEHAQLLEAALARNTKDPDVMFLLAQVHGRLGNQPRQQELLSQSQSLMKLRSRIQDLMDLVWSRPDNVESRLELAAIFDDLGDSAQAAQWRQAAAGCQRRVQSIQGNER